MSWNDNDSNPMSGIGYGRGDDTAEAVKAEKAVKKTQGYSYVDPDRIDPQRIIGVGKLQPIENLSVRDVIQYLIECNVSAWRAFPSNVKKALTERPQEFQLLPNEHAKTGDIDYNVLYNGTIWKYSGHLNVWYLLDIVR